MKPAARLPVVAGLAALLAVGAWLAARGTGTDQRNLDAFVTVGGDVAHDAIHPALDLTRITSGEEAELGIAIDAEVRRSMPTSDDAGARAYLDHVMRPMAANVSRAGIPYIVTLMRSEEVNAFAVPGGRLYVTEGLLRFVESEAELAAVVGHEISHVDLRHCVERMQLGLAAKKISPAAGSLARFGYEVMLLGFSEEQELAADRNGALLAARAGYDPWQAETLFGRFARRFEDPGRRATPRDPVRAAAVLIPDALRRYLATHPPADLRIESVRSALKANPGLWLRLPRYVGRSNLAARLAKDEDERRGEWITRSEVPAAGDGAVAANGKAAE